MSKTPRNAAATGVLRARVKAFYADPSRDETQKFEGKARDDAAEEYGETYRNAGYPLSTTQIRNALSDAARFVR